MAGAMNRNQIHTILLRAFANRGRPDRVPGPPSHKPPSNRYSTMAPIEPYLMDRDAEIALARGAAPDAISHDASLECKNGWVCSDQPAEPI